MSNLAESRYAARLRKQRGETDFTRDEMEGARRENPYEYLGWGDERYALQQVADQVALLRFSIISALSKDEAEYTPLWQPGQKLPGQDDVIEIDPSQPGFSLEQLGL